MEVVILKNKKDIIPILIAICPYIYIGRVLVTKSYIPFSIPVFAMYFLLISVLYTGSIIYVICKKDQTDLASFGLLIAVAHFPLQIIGVMVSAGSMFIVFVPFFTLPVAAVNIILWSILYVDLLLCSVYGVKAVFMLDKTFFSKKIFLSISQFFFCCNVIGSFLIFLEAKKQKENTSV